MRITQLVFLAIVLCTPRYDALAADPLSSTSSGRRTITLVTRLGDRLPGHWLATDDPATIAWQVDGFVGPFQLGNEQLSEIQIRHETNAPQIEGTYRCELANGDVLIGTPLAIDNSEFVFKISGSRPLTIPRNRLRRLSPWSDTGQAIRSTPSALGDWMGSPRAWQESVGRLTAIEDHAELISSLSLGDKSQISLRIAWKGQPDFRIDFGSSDTWDQGLRLETWQEELVLVAESPQAADLLLVASSVDSGGELLLHVFIDSGKRAILVVTDTGEALGELTWRGELKNKFRIQARRRGFHFYSATVAPWDGFTPEVLAPVQSSVITKEGKSERATVTAWNADAQSWTVGTKGDSLAAKPVDRQVSSAEIEAILFAGQPLSAASAAQRDSVQVGTRTGMKFTGKLVKLGDDAVELRCRGVKQPITIPLSHLRSLVFLPEQKRQGTSLPKVPRLRIGEASIVGQLVDGLGDGQATALVWKPSASETAAAIAHHASGSVTYREPPRQLEKPSASRPKIEYSIVDGIVGLFASSQTGKASLKPSPGPTLYLRSGDRIPCHPKSIDGQGVTFASSVTEATFAPQAAMRALVLVGDFQPARVTEEQRDRLLTLPRIQQEYPPRHLLLSVDGDLLRTRVTAMNDQFITTEIRLNQVNVPRERVAAIAWLHQDKLQHDPEDDPATSTTRPLLHVQAIQSDGVRLTFRPQQLTDGVLSGESDLLGNCRVEVTQVEKFLFGEAIEEALQQQSHQLLTLRPAIAPRFLTAESTAPTHVGQGSALVGRQAPPLKLKDLSGSTFDLTKHRGKVVVLDFWATWCGPCIQWMPELEAIIANYSDEEVELITINLLQEKAVIGPALERMQIRPTVLLDRDGVVADAYQATAIPQTVIVDQRGKIDRLFIGGSPQIKQPLIEALDALTSGPAANY